MLSELERFRPFIRIQPQYEVGLYVWNVSEDHVDVFGDLLDFIRAFHVAGLRFVAQVVPRLNARQQCFEPIQL